MVRHEVGFDLAAIFSSIPIEVGVTVPSFYLLGGDHKVVGPIKVQDEQPASLAGGKSRSFAVVRQLKDDKPFERIGNASYGTLDGLLEKLDATIKIGDSSVRILIERL